METVKAKAAIEAILFAMGNSVEFQTIGKALEIETAQVRRIVSEMSEEYKKEERGIQIIIL